MFLFLFHVFTELQPRPEVRDWLLASLKIHLFCVFYGSYFEVSSQSSQTAVCGYRRPQKHIVTVFYSGAVWSGPVRPLFGLFHVTPVVPRHVTSWFKSGSQMDRHCKSWIRPWWDSCIGRKESRFVFLVVSVVLLSRLRCGHHVWGLQGGFSSWFKIENQRPHIHKGLDRRGVSKHLNCTFVCVFVCCTVKYLLV